MLACATHAMPRIQTSSITLHCETTGQGPPVLFIHGLGSCTEDWEPQVRAFSGAYQVITFDLRGHGRSDVPRGPYSIPLFAADTAGLLATLPAGPAHVVGLSLGGCVAMQLALDDPGRVRSLVIVNSAPEFIRRSLFTLLEGMRRTVIVHWRGLRALGERISRRLLPDPAQEALRAAFVERFAQNDPSAYLNSLKALVGWSVTARLPAIRCPTLIVASEHDYTPVGMQEKYARRIPGARFVTIPGAHHAVPVERPNTFNAVLADFWTMLDAPPEMPPPAPPGA